MKPGLVGGWSAEARKTLTGPPIEGRLAAEAVERLALALEGVDHIHSRDGLAASVLGVGHGVADDVLQEYLEDATSLRMQ